MYVIITNQIDYLVPSYIISMPLPYIGPVFFTDAAKTYVPTSATNDTIISALGAGFCFALLSLPGMERVTSGIDVTRLPVFNHDIF